MSDWSAKVYGWKSNYMKLSIDNLWHSIFVVVYFFGAATKVVEVLQMIFESPDNRYPTVEELVLCDLFRNIDLREMRGPSISVSMTPSTTSSYVIEMFPFSIVEVKVFSIIINW